MQVMVNDWWTNTVMMMMIVLVQMLMLMMSFGVVDVVCLASLTTLHLQVPCKLHDCLTVRDHDVPVLINAACLEFSQLDISTRQVLLYCLHVRHHCN